MTDDAVRTAVLAVLVLAVSLAGTGGLAAALAAGPASGTVQHTDAPVAAQADGPAGGLGAETFAQTGVDADRTVLQVRLADNGSARWQVDYRVELNTENDTAAFESLQADIADDESAYTTSFRDRIERTAAAAENATGRQMAIRDVRVSTTTESVQSVGVVTYSFRWAAFGTVTDGRIEAGDALAGFFLERDSRLVLSWPDGYEATTLSPTPDDRRDTGATWQGPIEFGPEGPQIVAAPAGGLPVVPVAVALAVVLALAVGVVLYRRRRGDTAAGGTTAAGADGTTDDTGAATDTAAANSGDPTPDEELLSNEERVMRLLNERGGRVKQQDVAGEFDWTDAKTSQVVNSLKDEGEIDVFRLGRENVLVLPEESDL